MGPTSRPDGDGDMLSVFGTTILCWLFFTVRRERTGVRTTDWTLYRVLRTCLHPILRLRLETTGLEPSPHSTPLARRRWENPVAHSMTQKRKFHLAPRKTKATNGSLPPHCKRLRLCVQSSSLVPCPGVFHMVRKGGGMGIFRVSRVGEAEQKADREMGDKYRVVDGLLLGWILRTVRGRVRMLAGAGHSSAALVISTLADEAEGLPASPLLRRIVSSSNVASQTQYLGTMPPVAFFINPTMPCCPASSPLPVHYNTASSSFEDFPQMRPLTVAIGLERHDIQTDHPGAVQSRHRRIVPNHTVDKSVGPVRHHILRRSFRPRLALKLLHHHPQQCPITVRRSLKAHFPHNTLRQAGAGLVPQTLPVGEGRLDRSQRDRRREGVCGHAVEGIAEQVLPAVRVQD